MEQSVRDVVFHARELESTMAYTAADPAAGEMEDSVADVLAETCLSD